MPPSTWSINFLDTADIFGETQSGCAWCPHFDPAEFRKIGVQIAPEPVFE